MKKIKLHKIKLIIWDLDDTFWNGTLSEYNSTIILNQKNIELVENLVDYGIMNSICSKNDYESVKKEFQTKNLGKTWEYFLFPSINYESKGARIKDIILKMQLREENVLFIDDNKINLEEAKHFCPNLIIAMPDIINEISKQLLTLKTHDFEHKRLKRYKILENKTFYKKKFNSNEEFLIQSNISVEFKQNCIEQIDRIVDLFNRTNQLNYTKVRLDKNDVINILKNTNLENKYICVKDKYGDYGVCGFYSLNKNNNQLLHFMFSCSILGMGIEQYVYQYLKFPKLDVVGNVSVKLEKYNKTTYIN